MQIIKRHIEAAEAIEPEKDIEVEPDVQEDESEAVYGEACDAVKSAIDTLGKYVSASGDVFARDCIANLSVVLLDMKTR